MSSKIKFFNQIGVKITTMVVIPILLTTFIAVYTSIKSIEKQGIENIEEKSQAILHRTEHVRDYVATQGSLPTAINEAKALYQDGNLPENIKEKIKKQVPVIAAWSVAMADADKDNYTFKIASVNPRNPKNKASEEEIAIMKRFENEKVEYLTFEDTEQNKLRIVSPVYLNAAQGCLTCHGAPENSPFGNGKDIIGYPMENMKDGDMKGMFTIETDLKPLNAKINEAIWIIVRRGFVVALLGSLIAFFVSKKIIKGIKKLKVAGEAIKDGNYDTDLIVTSKDELGELADSLQEMVESFKKGVNYAKKIAEGDLRMSGTIDISKLSPLEKSMMTMELKLNEVVVEILAATEDISLSANLLRDRSESIASGANRQAASTEEVSASMEEMVSNIDQSTENASHAEKISIKAANGISTGNQSFTITVQAMREIADKIKIIGTIAARTDILAINAAIEAARSGEHGRGFAVVAAEIRKLAESSKQAAERIQSVVSSGVKVAEEAGVTLAEITPEVKQTAQLLQEIANAGHEQNSGANQINDAIQELTRVIQENTEAADRMSYEAINLNEKAQNLKESVSYFKVNKLED